MRPRLRPKIALLSLSVFVVLADADLSRAQPAAGGDLARIVRTPVLDTTLPAPKALAALKGMRIVFGPGQASGRHQHPVPTTGAVIDGAILFQVAGQPVRTMHAGEAFFEPADTTIARFDNASATQPATIVAFYMMGPGETEIVRPAP